MTLQFNEIIYFSILLCAFVLFLLTWPRRKTPGGEYFALHLAGLAIWAIGLFFEAANTRESIKILWSQISYIGFVIVTPMFFLFVLAYTSQSKVNRLTFTSLLIVPFITLVAAWTNQWHHLLWTGFYWGDRALNVLVYQHGFLFYLHIVYIYLLMVLGIATIIYAIPRNRPPFRSQLFVILIGVLFPIISGSLYVFGLEPVTGMDISIFGFLLTNLLLTYGFVRYQLLDLVPIAKGAWIEHLQDGMIVVDWMDRIVEINQNALDLLNIGAEDLIGRNVDTIFPWKLDLRKLSMTNVLPEYSVKGEKTGYINLQVSSLAANLALTPGYLLVIRDITAQKQAENDLIKANDDLKSQLVQINQLQIMLKDQASHDSLTSLYNRRAMDELLNEMLNQAKANNFSFSVAILDIDHFKRFNDVYGHQTGDVILQKYSKTIMHSIRKHDIACRFGGDEILLAFQEMSLENAMIKANEIRQALKQIGIEQNESRVSTTASIGVSVYPLHGKTIRELIRMADQALYEAKERGRDRVIQAPIPPAS